MGLADSLLIHFSASKQWSLSWDLGGQGAGAVLGNGRDISGILLLLLHLLTSCVFLCCVHGSVCVFRDRLNQGSVEEKL